MAISYYTEVQFAPFMTFKARTLLTFYFLIAMDVQHILNF